METCTYIRLAEENKSRKEERRRKRRGREEGRRSEGRKGEGKGKTEELRPCGN